MEFTKADRRKLSELAELAYARELEHDLGHVASACRDWRDGHMDALALDDLVRDYVQGTSKEAYERYSTLEPETAVARAVAVHLLEESEIPRGLREKLGRSIQSLRDILDEERRPT